MKPIIYLDPKKFFPKPRLDDVLVLMPSHSGPRFRTRAFLDALAEAGVTICISYGITDVALHRCLVAGRAVRGLTKDYPGLNYVFWLDDDMFGTPEHVAFLRAAVDAMPYQGAVTGIYCKRNNPKQITIRPYAGEESYTSSLMFQRSYMIPQRCEFETHPVLAGMGCMMLKKQTFLEHCAASPQFETHTHGEAPAICASGPCLDETGKFGWVSEDQCYSTGLWKYAGGVWTTPIAFSHLAEVPLLPLPDSEWLETYDDTANAEK